MRRSTRRHARRRTDFAGNIRAEMGRAQITAMDLSRIYGAAPSYWTRRLNGEIPFTADDLDDIAEAVGCHVSVLVGGEPPVIWLPRRDSNLQPSGYLHWRAA